MSEPLAVSVRAAYDAAAATWERGPGRVYARLAEAQIDAAEFDPSGRRVLDLGSGAGAVSAIVLRLGGHPVGLDASIEMASATTATGADGVQGDASALPFRPARFDAVVAAFLINHMADPVPVLREARRVLRPGGVLLASTFGVGPDHPVKAVVDAAAAEIGWRPQPWYQEFKSGIEGRVAEPDAVAGMARAAGFATATAIVRTVDVGPLEADALVEYRLGMGSLAEFVNELTVAERDRLVATAVERLGARPEPLRPAVMMLTAVAPPAPRPPD